MIPNRKTVIEMTIGLLVIAGTVQAATFINTCPFLITSPGDYLLGADLICGAGDGITILSNDVTLKFEGHSITYHSEGANRAIVVNPGFELPGLERVRILGPGLITNGGGNALGMGVAFNYVTNSEVSGLTMLGFSIQAQNRIGDGFLTITKNTIGQMATGPGITLLDVLSSTISENYASANNIGISILVSAGLASQANMISHNICNGNAIDGLAISGGPATVRNNVTSGNGRSGIHIVFGASMPPAVVVNNTSLANRTNDLFDVAPGCSGQWSGNTFFTANQSCIH
jgi:hypothetical protein